MTLNNLCSAFDITYSFKAALQRITPIKQQQATATTTIDILKNVSTVFLIYSQKEEKRYKSCYWDSTLSEAILICTIKILICTTEVLICAFKVVIYMF